MEQKNVVLPQKVEIIDSDNNHNDKNYELMRLRRLKIVNTTD